jgi:hypothetical protein
VKALPAGATAEAHHSFVLYSEEEEPLFLEKAQSKREQLALSNGHAPRPGKR